MPIERSEQSKIDRQSEHDEHLSQVIPESEGIPNFHPKVRSRDNIVPFPLPEKNEASQEEGAVHKQVPNHDLPLHIPEKKRNEEFNKLISDSDPIAAQDALDAYYQEDQAA